MDISDIDKEHDSGRGISNINKTAPLSCFQRQAAGCWHTRPVVLPQKHNSPEQCECSSPLAQDLSAPTVNKAQFSI